MKISTRYMLIGFIMFLIAALTPFGAGVLINTCPNMCPIVGVVYSAIFLVVLLAVSGGCCVGHACWLADKGK